MDNNWIHILVRTKILSYGEKSETDTYLDRRKENR